jgi:membrane-bound metal-dependent hydrolase YbcI (DUF457 family)
MDNITQWVIWWALYTLITGKHNTKTIRLWGLISNIPDLDLFVAKIITYNPIDQFFFHRGIMHSLLFNTILSFILWYVLYRLDPTTSYWRYVLWSFVSIVFWHLIIDGMTSYGMRYFLPRNSMVYSRDTIFVIDFGMWIITIACFICYHLITHSRALVAKILLILVWFYISITFGLNYWTHQMNIANRSVSHSGEIIKSITLAEPLQPFLRRTIIETSSWYWEWYRSIRDNQELQSWKLYNIDPLTQHIVLTLADQDTMLWNNIRKVLHFTRWYYRIVVTQSGYRIENLIFGTINGWKSDSTRMFSFDLVRDKKWYILTTQFWSNMSLSWKMRNDFRSRVYGKV